VVDELMLCRIETLDLIILMTVAAAVSAITITITNTLN
jgi:hypothetical protein